MFRRRRPDLAVEELAEDATDATTADAAATDGRVARAVGPWDVEDAPERPRLDLGGIRVAVSEGLELRLEVDQTSQQVLYATIVDGASAAQVMAFAAPRSTGIWDEVRGEIREALVAGGGSAEEVDGPFGVELRGRAPGEMPGQGVVLQPARFLGVDGPRWFLRALVTGPAATDPVQGRRIESALADVVVVRGGEAMAPRDLIPLRLPREATEATGDKDTTDGPGGAEASGQPAAAQQPTFDPFERGPEITEVR